MCIISKLLDLCYNTHKSDKMGDLKIENVEMKAVRFDCVDFDNVECDVEMTDVEQAADVKQVIEEDEVIGIITKDGMLKCIHCNRLFSNQANLDFHFWCPSALVYIKKNNKKHVV